MVPSLKISGYELDSEAEDEKDTFWEKNGPFWRTYREILEIDCVSDSAAPPKSKTMPEMKYLDTKASQEFFDFFSKNIFSQYFPKISTAQNPKFRDLTGLAGSGRSGQSGRCPYIIEDRQIRMSLFAGFSPVHRNRRAFCTYGGISK